MNSNLMVVLSFFEQHICDNFRHHTRDHLLFQLLLELKLTPDEKVLSNLDECSPHSNRRHQTHVECLDVYAKMKHHSNGDNFVNLDVVKSAHLMIVRFVPQRIRQQFKRNRIQQTHEKTLIEFKWNYCIDANDADDTN